MTMVSSRICSASVMLRAVKVTLSWLIMTACKEISTSA